MPNTLSPETALEVATARGDAWRSIATHLGVILQSVVAALQKTDPEAAEVVAGVAIGPIERGLMMAASEADQASSTRLGDEEVAEALALETDVSDAADLPMSMRLR